MALQVPFSHERETEELMEIEGDVGGFHVHLHLDGLFNYGRPVPPGSYEQDELQRRMGLLKEVLADTAMAYAVGSKGDYHAEGEIDRLANFLMERYPNEIGRGDFVNGESAVDVAIRLLGR